MQKLPCQLRYSSQQSHKCADWRLQNCGLFLFTSEMPSALYNLFEPIMTLAPTPCPTCVFSFMVLLMHSTHDRAGPPRGGTWEGTAVNIQYLGKSLFWYFCGYNRLHSSVVAKRYLRDVQGTNHMRPTWVDSYHQPITSNMYGYIWHITNSIKWWCLPGSTLQVWDIAIQERAAAMKRSHKYAIFMQDGATR